MAIMKLYARILMLIGLVISTGVGIWHFLVPYIYDWYSYIPDAPKNIIVSIDWINLLFSLLLTGNSILLIIFHQNISEKERFAVVQYGFLVFVWLVRIIVTIVHPWAYDWMFVGQLIAFLIVFALLAIPLGHIAYEVFTQKGDMMSKGIITEN